MYGNIRASQNIMQHAQGVLGRLRYKNLRMEAHKMFKIVDENPKPTRLEKEFKAVKRLAKDNLNFDWLVIAYSAFLSLMVLITLVIGDAIAWLTVSLIIVIGICIFMHVLISLGIIYPLRFRILYKKR